jgi:hypothetical protein
MTGSRRLWLSAGALGLVALASAAGAAAAPAATLKVRVPAHLHRGDQFMITITGTFKHSELSGRAYLIAAIQGSSASCKATAQLENRIADPPQWYFEPPHNTTNAGIFESHSPFTRTDTFMAGKPGSRRVCAYLYPKFIKASDTVAPIASASATYKVTNKA